MEVNDLHHHWEDEIDIDDTDLSSLLNTIPTPIIPSSSSIPPRTLLLPPLRACSQTLTENNNGNDNESDPSPPKKTLIPGPAGSVQAAMRRKSASAAAAPRNLPLGLDHPSLNLMEEVVEEEDEDFKLSPWISALNFLGPSGSRLGSPIVSIKNQRKSPADRISQMVGIVKSCVPNGLGDLFITLKDPTGTIGASVNRKVLLEGNLGGDVSVGCVLILKQVSVFCPARSSCYLNVTPNNVLKLISKDCNTPHKGRMPSMTVRNESKGKHLEIEPRQTERVLKMRCNTDNAAGNETIGRAGIEKMMASRKTGLDGSLPHSISTTQISNSLDVPPTRVVTADVATRSNPRTSIITNMTPKIDLRANQNCVDDPASMPRKPDARSDSNCAKDGTTDMPAKTDFRTAEPQKLISRNTVAQWPVGNTNMPGKTDLRTAEPKKLIPKVSVAQWTDEQLSELFADYPDDLN
ncbi:uncharacterized protein M6B38_120695 [Iris pallida]|uniref:Homologous recombination OB-fold protein OB-fold domain-containing protein n=1 Tax=Iris pallida TaxID=29817 RepID=A0AAX6H8N3_IRIPA|nr:uncharacterized protein M6B38_120695 [Iris pallida]